MRSKRLKREFLEITSLESRFLPKKRKYLINISYKTGVEITPRTSEIAKAFGLGIEEEKEFIIYDNFSLEIGEKDIVYITGDSGSGKSVLLRKLEEIFKDKAVNMNLIEVEKEKPIIETVGESVGEAIEILSRVGLNDAFLFLRKYSELSDGQKYRYRLAKLVESKAQIWICDEFCSLLDRETAKIVAYNVQKMARKLGKGVFVATCHTDLLEDLKPNVHIHKRFGKEVNVQYYEPLKDFSSECSLLRQVRIEAGNRQDYLRLADFHYRSHKLPPPRQIFKASKNGEVVGVIVYSYPALTISSRRLALKERLSFKELNERLSCISRVVVHPKYRSIGLGQKLVKETLARCGTPCVEAIAVMAKYNPFFEKAGMKKIAVHKPSQKIVEMANKLLELGFNLDRMSSKSYNLKVLMGFSKKKLEKVREALASYPHPRLVRHLTGKATFMNKNSWRAELEKAGVERLASLIRHVSILSQTKVYLFWQKEPASIDG